MAVLSTFEHRSFDLADIPMVFKPQTDLAILNFIAHYIIKNGKVNQEFIKKNVNFKKGETDIGYGLRPGHALEKDAKANGYPGADGKPKGSPNDATPISFEEYAKFVSEYTAEKVSELSGVPVKQARRSGQALRRPQGQGHVLLDHGLQPAHARHLGQQHGLQHPLADGQDQLARQQPLQPHGPAQRLRHCAREVGTFAHRLPADMVVTNPEHRKHTEEIWGLPDGTIPTRSACMPWPESRALKDGKLKCYWNTTNNNMQAGPNINGEILPGWRNPAAFVVVSDVYPNASAMAADLILPSAMWVEKEGAFGNAERRTSSGASRSRPRARRPTSGSSWSSASASSGRGLAGRAAGQRSPSSRARPCSTCSTRTARSTSSRRPTSPRSIASTSPDYSNDRSKAFGFYVQKGLFEEYAEFGRGHGTISPPFDVYHEAAACAGRWWMARKRCGALPRRAMTRTSRRGEGVKFYGNKDGRPWSLRCPTSPPPRPGQRLRPVAVHRPRAGALAHRHHDAPRAELHRAVPDALVFMHPDDAKDRWPAARHEGQVASRRGEITCQVETKGPQQGAAWPGLRALLRRRPPWSTSSRSMPPARSRRKRTSKCAVKVVEGLRTMGLSRRELLQGARSTACTASATCWPAVRPWSATGKGSPGAGPCAHRCAGGRLSRPACAVA